MGKTASPVDETPAASADNPTVPDHSAEESASTESKNVPKWLLATATAVAAVLVVALLVTSGFFIRDLRAAETRDALRADYVQTAKQAVLNLTTINDQTAKADIDRVLSVASGELKAEYSQRKDAYASVVEQAKVKATGEIIETALESDNTESARVLVAAKQTLTNAGMAEVQTRFYRFRVTVIRGDTGITASQVEFVA